MDILKFKATHQIKKKETKVGEDNDIHNVGQELNAFIEKERNLESLEWQ